MPTLEVIRAIQAEYFADDVKCALMQIAAMSQSGH